MRNHLNNVTFDMLYRVKNKVIEANSNPFSEDFLYLTSYLTELRKQNPHSIIHLQHTIDQDGHKRFGRLMVMMRATSEIVVRSCKPVISFDSCFLKSAEWSKYQLLVVGTCNDLLNELLIATTYHCIALHCIVWCNANVMY